MLRKIVTFAEELEEGATFHKRSRLLILDLYVLSSLLYYFYDYSIFSDGTYDKLCRYILRNFEEFKSVNLFDRVILNKNALKAGTGYHITVKRVPFINVLAHFYMEVIHDRSRI